MNKGVFAERGPPSPVNVKKKKKNAAETEALVILSPWSALRLMVCQFRALGSLHSNCQGYKARGNSECRVTDVPEGRVKKKKKKRLSMFGMCWGLSRYSFKSSFYCLYSCVLCKSSCNLRVKHARTCSAQQLMKCSTMLSRLSGTEYKHLLSEDPAIVLFITPLFLHVQLYHLVQIEYKATTFDSFTFRLENEKNNNKKKKGTFLNPRLHYFFKMSVWRLEAKGSGDYKAPRPEKKQKSVMRRIFEGNQLIWESVRY